ncbi:MAG: hypothetical protein ACRBDI_04235 [Alphaproteobacteria bacterium]
MRILGFLLVLATFATFVSDAQAKKNTSFLPWGGNDWRGVDFEPYIGEEQIRQRSLWDGDTWSPEAWIKDAGDEKRVMRDLYAADILVEQYTDGDNIPVLKVGENFIKLAGVDQRRVLQFVDYIFEITTAEENGMFYVIYSKDKKEPLGLYNKYGFQSY